VEGVSDGSSTGFEMPPRAHVRLLVASVCGVAGGVIVGVFGPWQAAPAAAWAVTAGVLIAWVLPPIATFEAGKTARLATREDPGRAAADLLLLGASVASLAAVGLVLAKGSSSHGASRTVYAATSLASVVVSWILVHILFTLRYARLYYSGVPGGVEFNQKDAPRYSDFAYLAFTVGMTFQVSDTNITSEAMRRAVLRHALLSYLFGAVILATAINLVAGFLK
jgi:uncharacterized membrane protein